MFFFFFKGDLILSVSHVIECVMKIIEITNKPKSVVIVDTGS